MEYYERRLPHFSVTNRPAFITWRLHGSLPKNRFFSESLNSGQVFAAMDRLLDRAATGPRHLAIPEIAHVAAGALAHGAIDLRLYELHAYVVMANHIHLLITPNVELAKLAHSLKRYTAREANLILGIIGKPFWQDESYDRLVRDATEFQRIRRYIENNPVRAGLVAQPEDYRWSSAGQDCILPGGF